MAIMQLTLMALVSMLAVKWTYNKVLKIARLKNLVDNPDGRKIQKQPVPVLGGLAVYFGLVCGMLFFTAISGIRFGELLPIFFSISIMLFVGMLDDFLGLSARSRIIIEILTISALIYASGLSIDSLQGLWGVNAFSWYIAVPLTILTGVGLINAYNMVDGVNGLSSGLCIVVSCFFAVVFYKYRDYLDCAIAVCFAASLIPFIIHNVFGNKSRMFIGDGGTMVMGVIICWFVMRILSSRNNWPVRYPSQTPVSFVALVWAFAAEPVFDTLRVMTGRILRRTSPFKPDKTHLHHVFIELGISHIFTSISIITINTLVVLAWFVAFKCGLSQPWQLFVGISAAIIFVWGSYFFLNYHLKHDTEFARLIRSNSGKTHFSHTKVWQSFQKFLDRGACDAENENKDKTE